MKRKTQPLRRKAGARRSATGGRATHGSLPRRTQADSEATGRESEYLNFLVETSRALVVVLRQGSRIAGRLAWYDQSCVKITPGDGSPALLIPKESIKYIYETAAKRPVA